MGAKKTTNQFKRAFAIYYNYFRALVFCNSRLGLRLKRWIEGGLAIISGGSADRNERMSDDLADKIDHLTTKFAHASREVLAHILALSTKHSTIATVELVVRKQVVGLKKSNN